MLHLILPIIYLLFEAFWCKKIWICSNPRFSMPLKVAHEVLHDRVLGSLRRRLLMTSTQEPNTKAPQSALSNCWRKWKAKLIVPIYFGNKTTKFWLRIIEFSSLESELSFDTKDSEINCDRARSTTVKWLLESNLQSFKRRRGRPLCGRADCLHLFRERLSYKLGEA